MYCNIFFILSIIRYHWHILKFTSFGCFYILAEFSYCSNKLQIFSHICIYNLFQNLALKSQLLYTLKYSSLLNTVEWMWKGFQKYEYFSTYIWKSYFKKKSSIYLFTLPTFLYTSTTTPPSPTHWWHVYSPISPLSWMILSHILYCIEGHPHDNTMTWHIKEGGSGIVPHTVNSIPVNLDTYTVLTLQDHLQGHVTDYFAHSRHRGHWSYQNGLCPLQPQSLFISGRLVECVVYQVSCPYGIKPVRRTRSVLIVLSSKVHVFFLPAICQPFIHVIPSSTLGFSIFIFSQKTEKIV